MLAITRDSLMTLEAYARKRSEFRAQVLAHKKDRIVHLGSHVTLLFEDELTMRYQIQEMLRVERIFEESEIQHELDAYNPLVPDGSNLKATMQIEYEHEPERRRMLAKLRGIERRVWVQVKDGDRVYAIADEDLPRETGEKTSAVHFLRFELTPEMKSALRSGGEMALGVDHPDYTEMVAPLAKPVRDALAADLGA